MLSRRHIPWRHKPPPPVASLGPGRSGAPLYAYTSLYPLLPVPVHLTLFYVFYNARERRRLSYGTRYLPTYLPTYLTTHLLLYSLLMELPGFGAKARWLFSSIFPEGRFSMESGWKIGRVRFFTPIFVRFCAKYLTAIIVLRKYCLFRNIFKTIQVDYIIYTDC